MPHIKLVPGSGATRPARKAAKKKGGGRKGAKKRSAGKKKASKKARKGK